MGGWLKFGSPILTASPSPSPALHGWTRTCACIAWLSLASVANAQTRAPATTAAPVASGPAAAGDSTDAAAGSEPPVAALPQTATPQPAAAPATAPAAAPIAAPVAEEVAPERAADLPPPPTGAPPVLCVPRCRSGYACLEGRCVSSCHPPCAAGERCESGACAAGAGPDGEGGDDGEPRWQWDSEKAAVDSTRHRHDGMLVRATVMSGGGRVKYTAPSGAQRMLPGSVGQLLIDVGATTLMENLAVFGRLGITALSGKRADVVSPDDSTDRGATDSLQPIHGGLLLGVGLTHFMMPLNLHLTGVLALEAGALLDHNGEARQDVETSIGGFRLQLEAAKEWWVGGNWGIGVGLRLGLGRGRATEIEPADGEPLLSRRPSDDPYESTYNYLGLGLFGSVTYQ